MACFSLFWLRRLSFACGQIDADVECEGTLLREREQRTFYLSIFDSREILPGDRYDTSRERE
jgi:hypothetical protein